MLTVVAQTKTKFVGYDIFTDEFKEIDKSERFILLSKPIMDMMDINNRFMLAAKISTSAKQCSKILHVNDKYIFEKMKKLYLSEETVQINKERHSRRKLKHAVEL